MRKRLSLVLCVCILFSAFTLNVKANEVSIASSSAIKALSSEPTADNLKKITTMVKSKITIPKSLTNFDYQYNTERSNSTAYWELIWSNSKETDRISVTCDKNGNIINYYHSTNDDYQRNKPKYLKSELKTKADQFIKKIAPTIYYKLESTESAFNSIYSGQYTYQYQRIEGKIPMPDNGVSVSVNYETGEVVSCSINWLYNVTIPSPDTKITKQEAASKLGSNNTMKLTYRNAYNTDKKGNTTIRAFLVYEPDKSYASVDAKTGKIYLTRDEWLQNASNETSTEMAKDAASGDKKDSKLTDKEIASISKLNGLISKENAIKQVTGESSLLIDSSATSVSANLVQIYSSNDKNFVWNINFSDPRAIDSEKDSYRANASATVDAKTGKILSFYASVPNYYDIDKNKWNDIKVTYSMEQGKSTFENFLKKQIPSYFNNTILSNTDHDYIVAYKEETPVYGGYRYNYDRVHEGVSYEYNGISGSVDGVTGKIYRYNFNWDETVNFQSTKGVMSPQAAYNHYIDKDGYGLVYEINTIHNLKDTKVIASTNYSVKYEVRLVYRADINPSTISPFTGKQLDNNGEVYKKEVVYSYTDISSSKAKNAILILADMGVGFEGNKFLPNQKITTKEFITLLSKLQYNTEDLGLNKNTKYITRTNAVKSLITLADLEKVAKIQGIYKTNFKDEKQIPSKDIGYVALAKGLGIVTGTTFKPNASLTRGEAAQMIVNFLKADIK